MVFCTGTEPYGHHREYVQTLCTLSVLHFQHIFCAKARIFFPVRPALLVGMEVNKDPRPRGVGDFLLGVIED